MTDPSRAAPQIPDAAALEAFCPPPLRSAAAQLAPVLYEDLRRIAHRERGRSLSAHTLNTTALVHDAFLRLSTSPAFASHTHFLRAAAVTMRHLLVDRARQQLAAKHGAGLTRVEFHEALDFHIEEDAWVVALHDALLRLAERSPRMAEVVECRVFAGYGEAETAQALGMSLRTVQRDWTLARAWLRRELGDDARVPR